MKWASAGLVAAFTAVAVAGCSGPEFGVDGVERNEASCTVPKPSWTVLASYGNLGYGTSTVEWSGGVRVQDLRDAFRRVGAAAGVESPTGDQWEQVRSAVDARVLETFPARTSEVTVRTAAGERKVVYELRCRYRVAVHRGDQRFRLDVEGGSGLWEVRSTPMDQRE
ncbi:hypothetical protein [Tsukamurella spumae]|uniref:Lipoprotein n=1 Tax=Tsukamurella spumae TaxID=44753 RepID=A0A846X1P5_9ACTN|nr:hypothetical protein [Tsukamurella spumae]NKY19204.1 hypothetical protein [Tsukamurella spumae]